MCIRDRSRIYLNENNLSQALVYSRKSLALAKELELPETKMNNEKLLSEIFEKQGNKDSAFVHLKKYEKEKEKLAIEENAKERIKTELNFQYEKSKIEEKELASREKLKWFFGLIILGIIGISGFLYYRNRASRKNILLQKQLGEFQYKALHLQICLLYTSQLHCNRNQWQTCKFSERCRKNSRWLQRKCLYKICR